jgi:TctA family transporter
MLVVINLPLIGIWVRFLRTPYRLLFPTILFLCSIGAYTLNSAPFEVGLMAFFGVVGYLFYKLGCEPAPLILAMILGPHMEEHLRRALLLSYGDPFVFVERPISLGLIVASIALIVVFTLPALRKARG